MAPLAPTTVAIFSTNAPVPSAPVPGFVEPTAAPLSSAPGEVVETSQAAVKLAQLNPSLGAGLPPTLILGTQANRKFLLIVNAGAGDVLLGFDVVPRTGNGIPLVAGQSALFTNPSCSNAIYALAPFADAQLQILVG